MKRIIFPTILFLMIFLTACSNQDEVTTEEGLVGTDKSTEEQPVNSDPVSEPKNMFPLTGIKTDQEIMQRPYGVIINNHPKARPQSGLFQADIVYEILAEGDVTRFLAIYQSEQPKKIGPVRSARDYYVDLSKGYDAFFVAHGWSPDAEKMLQAGEVDNINGMIYDGSLFKRDSSRVAPHNSYISYEDIKKGADQLGKSFENSTAPLMFLPEEEIATITGDTALDVKVAYSSRETFSSEYKYNKELEKYERYSNNEQTADRETSNTVLLDNVFIVEMDHRVIDNVGRKAINIASGGKALLLQKGVAIEAEWRNVDGRIVPYKDDKEVGFVPGKTWINIIPSSPGITGSVSFGN